MRIKDENFKMRFLRGFEGLKQHTGRDSSQNQYVSIKIVFINGNRDGNRLLMLKSTGYRERFNAISSSDHGYCAFISLT